MKTGAGAFAKDEADARGLARTMVDLGTDAGVRTVALLTDMSAPLGRTAGNGLEVRESLEVLAGGGPADVVELTVALAREMLESAGVRTPTSSRAGRRSRHGHLARHDRRPGRRRERAAAHRGARRAARATEDGVVTGLDAMGVGVAAWRLARAAPAPARPCETPPASRSKHLGEEVRSGDVLARLHTI